MIISFNFTQKLIILNYEVLLQLIFLSHFLFYFSNLLSFCKLTSTNPRIFLINSRLNAFAFQKLLKFMTQNPSPT